LPGRSPDEPEEKREEGYPGEEEQAKLGKGQGAQHAAEGRKKNGNEFIFQTPHLGEIGRTVQSKLELKSLS
jgi:hypothetical protein